MIDVLRMMLAICFLLPLGPATAAEKTVESDSPAMVFSRVSGSVVLIRAETAGGIVQGSGVIVGKGSVVTNLHVIARATRILVSLRGKESVATVAATSKPARDLALLSADTMGGSRVTLRRSTDLVVGERVFAVGNPRGYEQTLTEGLVSALRKEGEAFVVQTSASISPGSSGGGLFDTRGRLVGITTKTRTDGQSLNFANPVEWINDLLKGGEASGAPGDGGVMGPQFSVNERPEGALCELSETARWGVFTEGIELLESSPTTGAVLFTALDSTQPDMVRDTATSSLVLKDMSRKSQVAVFRNATDNSLVFISFEESGDVRATLTYLISERGEARLLTYSGSCRTGGSVALREQLRAKVPPQLTDDEVCESQPGKCYALATQYLGGERFLYLKKACRIGHRLACDDALRMAESVGDTANAALLKRFREVSQPQDTSRPAANPSAPPPAHKRKPLDVR